jgi:hypothetical protein
MTLTHKCVHTHTHTELCLLGLLHEFIYIVDRGGATIFKVGYKPFRKRKVF